MRAPAAGRLARRALRAKLDAERAASPKEHVPAGAGAHVRRPHKILVALAVVSTVLVAAGCGSGSSGTTTHSHTATTRPAKHAHRKPSGVGVGATQPVRAGGSEALGQGVKVHRSPARLGSGATTRGAGRRHSVTSSTTVPPSTTAPRPPTSGWPASRAKARLCSPRAGLGSAVAQLGQLHRGGGGEVRLRGFCGRVRRQGHGGALLAPRPGCGEGQLAGRVRAVASCRAKRSARAPRARSRTPAGRARRATASQGLDLPRSAARRGRRPA